MFCGPNALSVSHSASDEPYPLEAGRTTSNSIGNNNGNDNTEANRKHTNRFISSESDSQVPLPSDRPNYNFTVSICLLILDDEAYLTEWIDYHLIALEFDRIFVYDNSKSFELSRWYENTRSHPIYSRVAVHHFPGKHVQNSVYGDCVREHGPTNDYLALIDSDEFIVPRQFFTKHNSIHAVLAEYLVPFGGALVLNWSLFGTANKTRYAPVPVTKRYQLRDVKPDGVIKTIVKSSDFKKSKNPHSVSLREGTTVRTTKYPGKVQKEQFKGTGASDNDLPSDVLLLHHYRYKSLKEYTIKRCQRGEVDNIFRGCDTSGTKLASDELYESKKVWPHIKPRIGNVPDDLAWRILKARVPKYRVFDDEAWEDFE